MNLYDDFQPDVPALLKAQDAVLPAPDPHARSADGLGLVARAAGLARLYGLGLMVRLGLHRRLVYANLRLGWFEEFNRFWSGELGNRPIQPHDFYYLFGVYRQRLQTIHFPALEDPALASDALHLDAWRDPRLVYHLFAHAYREALSPLRVHRFARYVAPGARIAEYGCGTAPIVTALARRYRHRDLQLVGADIPHLLFHYARWKLRDLRCVTMVPIAPDDDAPLSGRFDTVFCLEVLEHVPRPVAVLRHLHDVLAPGGYLVFDYVRSEGTGLDTATALRDRIPALEFIRERFTVVEGRVTTGGEHVAPTVVRKR